jgi:hypothetical protein
LKAGAGVRFLSLRRPPSPFFLSLFSLSLSRPLLYSRSPSLFPLFPPSTQLTYSTFISGLKTQGVTLNRKVLAALASQEPLSFKALVDQVGAMRGDSRPPRPPVGPGA